MGWKGYQLQKGGLSIITDKTEYEAGGILKVKIKNNFSKQICFSSCYPYLLESKNEKWESYKYVECQKLNGNGHCMKAGELKAFGLTLPQISDGSHRLAIPVCLGCKSEDTFKEDTRFYSNEFWIGEKKVEETANWKTYRNEEISFKYPPNFEYIGGEGQIDFYQKGTTTATLSFFSFSPAQIPLEEWLIKATSESGHKIISKEVRSFGEVENGILYIKEWPSGREQMGYVFNYGDKCYSFWNEDSTTQDLFLQMLSTFRFIEVDETADWKTYKNEVMSHPEFKKWLGAWQPQISVEKFTEGDVYSISPLWSDEDWYKIKSNYLSNPNFCTWENGCVYSPDKTKFIKHVISDPDQGVYVYDIQLQKLKSLADCGPACGFDTGFWLDDSRVVICGLAVPDRYSLYFSLIDLNKDKKYYYRTPEFSENPILQTEEFPFRAYLRKYWEEFGL